MKHKILALVLILAVLFVSTLSFAPSVATAAKENQTEIVETIETYNPAEALKARFENILNRNFSYDDDIADTDALVNNSILALLDKRDSDDENFISENIVREFVYDMYGVEVVDFSNLNSSFPTKNGFVYIIPRGFSVYEHEVTDICENEDGSYTVTSHVSIDSHDEDKAEFIATTLLIKNAKSSFGYNIIYSSIIENTIAL